MEVMENDKDTCFSALQEVTCEDLATTPVEDSVLSEGKRTFAAILPHLFSLQYKKFIEEFLLFIAQYLILDI